MANLYEDLASPAWFLVIHPSMELRASLSGVWVWMSTCDVIHYGGGGQWKDVGCSINLFTCAGFTEGWLMIFSYITSLAYLSGVHVWMNGGHGCSNFHPYVEFTWQMGPLEWWSRLLFISSIYVQSEQGTMWGTREQRKANLGCEPCRVWATRRLFMNSSIHMGALWACLNAHLSNLDPPTITQGENAIHCIIACVIHFLHELAPKLTQEPQN